MMLAVASVQDRAAIDAASMPTDFTTKVEHQRSIWKALDPETLIYQGVEVFSDSRLNAWWGCGKVFRGQVTSA